MVCLGGLSVTHMPWPTPEWVHIWGKLDRVRFTIPLTATAGGSAEVNSQRLLRRDEVGVKCLGDSIVLLIHKPAFEIRLRLGRRHDLHRRDCLVICSVVRNPQTAFLLSTLVRL